jgi:hypothetical protein
MQSHLIAARCGLRHTDVRTSYQSIVVNEVDRRKNACLTRASQTGQIVTP